MTTMPLLDNFAANLRDAMVLTGVTGQELSKRSGLHYVTISRILNGKLSPSVETCEKLAIAAGIRADTAFLEPLKKSG
jgi:transcriptional regulator with XRE-family HTH domain